MKRLDQITNHVSEFKLTLANNLLSPSQRQQYEKDGYVIIRNLVSLTDLEKYKQRFLDISLGKVKPEITMLVMKDLNTRNSKDLQGELKIAKLQDFQDDPVLFNHSKDPNILKYVECFIGPDVYFFNPRSNLCIQC